jgi:GntR family carbon starvation induced transcriptional regulator
MDRIERKSAVASATLSTKIAETLREQITRGLLLPGEKLSLSNLCLKFGVSLSPVREALSRLFAEGFVVMENRSGYRVAPVSESNLLEVMRLRLQLESFALRESIKLADMQWESEVVATLYRLEKIEKTQDKDLSVEKWEECHRALHDKLLSGCGMPLLLQFLSILHDLDDRYRRLFLDINPIDRNILVEHARICNAAVERDADRACALLCAHIEHTSTKVAKLLRKE